jgi:hypothetical protein
LFGKSCAQSAKHALDLLAVLSRMANGRNHDNPRLDGKYKKAADVLHKPLHGLENQ